jgi:hypothetical protein
VKGGPIEKLEPGRVYVLMFWATHSRWSADALRKLQAVAQAHEADVVKCAAISLWERAVPAPNADFAARVRAYAAEHGADWRFAVAYDGDFGRMNREWMHAADRRWIPTVFVVDKQGKVAWCGHPLDERDRLEDVVKGVVEGTWDIQAAATRAQKDADARTLLRQAERAWDFARRSGDTRELMSRLREMYESSPAVGGRRLGETLDAVFIEQKAFDTGYPWLREMSESVFKNDSVALNASAWFIVDAGALEKRDLDLAMAMALRASELTGGQQAHIEDTVARAYFEKGDLDRAIERQTQAVILSQQAERAGYEQTLERYKAAKQAAAPPAPK